MAILVKGILSFPKLFTPEIPKGGTESKYGVSVLVAPNDPQVHAITAQVDQAKRDQFPSGMPHGSDVCWMPYDQKFQGKEYYDPRFSGYHCLTCSAPANSKPTIVDANHIEIIDPSVIYSGCVAEVHTNIVGYTKGRGGVGSFVNGVKFSGEEGPFGRLDGRPTIDQMFGGTSAPAMQQPGPVQFQPPAATPAPVGRQMTPKANGVPYETFIAQGWTDVALIEHGYMLPPGNTPLVF